MATMKDARRAYLTARDSLLQYDNVIGVGFGARERGGRPTDEPAVIALVIRKVPRDKLERSQILPTTVHGVAVDVREPRLSKEAQQRFIEENQLDDRDNECAIDHFFIDDAKIHRLNQINRRRESERTDKEPGDAEPGDPSTAVFGEIFVIDDDGTLITDGTIDHIAAYNLFRTQFGDHYDFVFFHYDTASGVPNIGNSSPTVFNDITGINHYQGDSYNARAAWGSTMLQSYQKIPNLQTRRILHETAHRWCSYVYHRESGVYSTNLHHEFSVASQALYHWGTWFDNDNSCMDYDYNDWVDSSIVAGEFELDSLTAGAPSVDEFGFHPLDLYLMGLYSATEVGTFRYINSPTDADGNGSYAGTQVNLTVTNVTDEEGSRNPAFPDTQRVFHQAFILITNDVTGIGTLTSGVLGTLETYRKGHVQRFREAVRGRAMIDASLLHDNYGAIYIRDNTTDTGEESSSGAFWNSPDIWVRNINDGGTTHQDTVRGQDNYLSARVSNGSPTAYEDVTVRFYRANFAGTEFLYPEDWHPDDMIGETTINVPGSGSAVATVPWPAAMIPDATWHPCLLVEVIPMELTPNTRHHVWENRKLAQKNITIVDAPGDVAPHRIEFLVGSLHSAHKEAVLTIARVRDLPGLGIGLDAGETRLEPIRPDKIMPLQDYIGVDLSRLSDDDLQRPMLEVEFPDDTKLMLDAWERLRLTVTVGGGSRFRIDDLRDIESRMPALRGSADSKQLRVGRIAQARVLLATGRREAMSLVLHSAGTPRGRGSGLIRVIQSTTHGEVVGGLDIEVRA